MPRPKTDDGPGRYAHLADIIRGSSTMARWPAGSDRCPHCSGIAEFGFSTSPSTAGARYAIFQCGSCDASWRADRFAGKPTSKYTKNAEQKKRNREAQARRRQAARENAA